MKIQPVVEGYGDVEALPVLLRRFTAVAESWDVGIGTPIRQTRGLLVNQESLMKGRANSNPAAARAVRSWSCSMATMTVQQNWGPRIKGWAEMGAGGRPCEVVIAHREYEAWFLAAIESLRGQRGIREDAIRSPSTGGTEGRKGAT